MKIFDKNKSWPSIILITCLGIIIYSNTFNCSFHYDDFHYIVDNPFISNLRNLLIHWEFYPCRFITFLSIAINHHFSKFNVFGYHVFNLGLHVVSAILIWWLTILTLSTPGMKKNKISEHADLIALFAGLIFVSHPLQTEAVTYIWQRSTSMAALFYLTSLCLYVKARLFVCSRRDCLLSYEQTVDHKDRPYYIASLIIAIIAMFTKENTVTLPLMILLYEFCFFKTKKNINCPYLSPFLLTLFIIPLTILLTQSGGFLKNQGFIGPEIPSPLNYLLTQFRVIVTYIRLLFLPFNQNFNYDYPISKSIFEWPTLISFLFLGGILWGAKQLFAKYKLVSFSIFWFFLTLLPESSLLPINDVICEHRLYLPLAGYSLFLVSSAYYLSQRNTIKTMVIVLTLIITFNSILAYQRNKVWKNEITLWSDTVQKSPSKARPHYDLGLAYYKSGHLIESTLHYNKAIEIVPGLSKAYIGRGMNYAQEDNFAQALFNYDMAIIINDNATAALAYYNRGLLYDKQKNSIQAISDYTKAIEINPYLNEAYYYRGNDLTKQGDFNRSLSDYTKTIEINPNNAEAYNNRGYIYNRQKDYNKAIVEFTQAIKINPGLAGAYFNRAIAYYQLNKYDLTWEDVHQAQALGATVNPNFINALKNKSGQDR